jgi:hypothetical protein
MPGTVESATLRSMMRVWLLSAEMARTDLPRPPAAGSIQVAGDDPLRILLMGNGAAVGYGVLTHDLALAGHLARQLSALTRRGTELRVEADGRLTAASALRILESADLRGVDVVVMTLGMNETLALAPTTRWKRDLAVLFETIERMPDAPSVCMVAIPPMDSVTTFPPVLGAAADRHAARLNEGLGELGALYDSVRAVPFAPERRVETERYRSSDTYRSWAALIAGPIAAAVADHSRKSAIRTLEGGTPGPML